MKTFVKPLPANNNVKGSGTGNPAADMNKVSDALVEIRSSVPNAPSDIGAATASQLNELNSRISSLVSRIAVLKTTAISDAFSRTSLGASYTVISGSAPTLSNNQIVQGQAASYFVALSPTKTYHMYSKITVYATSTTVGHPQVICNYIDGSYYRGAYDLAAGAWQIYKIINGNGTLLSSFTDTRPTSTYTLKISQYQNTISLTVNDVVKTSASESSTIHGKQAGVLIPALSDSSAPARTLDDFVYGDI